VRQPRPHPRPLSMTRTSPRRLLGAAFPLLAMLVAGCDAVVGPPDLNPATPVAAGLELRPAAASVDTLARVGDDVVVPLALDVSITQGAAPVQRVAYAVQWQFACQAGTTEAAGEMSPAGDGRFAAAPDLTVPPGRRGAYRVAAWAVDASGRAGNETVRTFTLGGTNIGPPVIASVQAPAQLRPPATLRIVVNVSDPDGVDHIARAEIVTPGAGTLPLSDTDARGNSEACNGVYSIAFTVPRGVQPGTLPFIVRAFDRDGEASEPMAFTVEIIP
jgi:hypothetical protein